MIKYQKAKIIMCKCGMPLGIDGIFDARTICYCGIYMCTNCFQERKNMKCKNCGRVFNDGDVIVYSEHGYYCTNRKCSKPKEIPAIAIGNYQHEPHNRRLFIKINNSIKDSIVKYNATMIVIDPGNGQAVNWWVGNGINNHEFYENVKPL